MDKHIGSVVRGSLGAVALHSSQHEELDVTAQIELHRWEDDGGAMVTQARCSLPVVADCEHLQAA